MKSELIQTRAHIEEASTGLTMAVLGVEELAIPPSVRPASEKDECERATEFRACFSSQGIEVLVARLDVDPEVTPALVQLLDRPERGRASRFVFERDRSRFIVGRARLRQALAERLDVRPEEIEFVYGARGKPALSWPYADSNLRFNVSHCEDVAVYAFSWGREIGVDIEAVRQLPDADEIALRFFSTQENAAYLRLDPRDRPLGFFNCWTRKEAFIKAIGDGLYRPLDSFEVSLSESDPAQAFPIGNVTGDSCGWELYSFTPCSHYVGAVVAEKPRLRTDSAVPLSSFRSL